MFGDQDSDQDSETQLKIESLLPIFCSRKALKTKALVIVRGENKKTLEMEYKFSVWEITCDIHISLSL